MPDYLLLVGVISVVIVAWSASDGFSDLYILREVIKAVSIAGLEIGLNIWKSWFGWAWNAGLYFEIDIAELLLALETWSILRRVLILQFCVIVLNVGLDCDILTGVEALRLWKVLASAEVLSEPDILSSWEALVCVDLSCIEAILVVCSESISVVLTKSVGVNILLHSESCTAVEILRWGEILILIWVVVGGALPKMLRPLLPGSAGHLAVDIFGGRVVEEWLLLEEVEQVVVCHKTNFIYELILSPILIRDISTDE